MDKTLALQLQIRQNAEEISSALGDMTSWEKKMKEKDKLIRRGMPIPGKSVRKVTREGGTVPLKLASIPNASKTSTAITPASIVNIPSQGETVANIVVPQARGRFEQRDLEEAERERGNAEFKLGNFTAAVKSYTKCLGLKSNNHVAFSNRAMAYLKLKEYHRAVSDCDCALRIDNAHVKSLLRRSAAYNALGKHRAALQDLLQAQALEPSNKQARTDIAQTRELLRAAVNRAPHTSMRSYEDMLALRPAPTATSSSLKEHRDKEETQAEDNEMDVGGMLQGPDPRPASFILPSTNLVPSSSTSSSVAAANTTIDIPISSNNSNEGSAETVAADNFSPAILSTTPQPHTHPVSEEMPQDQQMHRIAIVSVDGDSDDERDDGDGNEGGATGQADDGEDEDMVSVPIRFTASTKKEKKNDANASPLSPVDQTKKKAKASSSVSIATSSPTKKKTTSATTSASKTTKKKDKTVVTMGAYELEQALVLAQQDIGRLRALLRQVLPPSAFSPSSSASSSSSKKVIAQQAQHLFARVVEPDVLRLFLRALLLVALDDSSSASASGGVVVDGDVKAGASGGGVQIVRGVVWQWCVELSNMSSFSLLYRLVDREHQEALVQQLRQMQQVERNAATDDVALAQEVVRRYESYL